jgi:hypothetical protein
MHQAIKKPERAPAFDVWKLYSSEGIARGVARWSHETLMLAIGAPKTMAKVTDCGAGFVEFCLSGVCDDGKRCYVTYTLYTDECELSKADRIRLYAIANLSLALNRGDIRKALALARGLGLGK